MNFKITGPGLYRTRDGKIGQVTSGLGGDAGLKWCGHVNGNPKQWNIDGYIYPVSESSNDLIAPWEEPVAPTTPTPTPYHRTEQFRAETARMIFFHDAQNPQATCEQHAQGAVLWTDALIAALDKPQPNTP